MTSRRMHVSQEGGQQDQLAKITCVKFSLSPFCISFPLSSTPAVPLIIIACPCSIIELEKWETHVHGAGNRKRSICRSLFWRSFWQEKLVLSHFRVFVSVFPHIPMINAKVSISGTPLFFLIRLSTLRTLITVPIPRHPRPHKARRSTLHVSLVVPPYIRSADAFLQATSRHPLCDRRISPQIAYVFSHLYTHLSKDRDTGPVFASFFRHTMFAVLWKKMPPASHLLLCHSISKSPNHGL